MPQGKVCGAAVLSDCACRRSLTMAEAAIRTPPRSGPGRPSAAAPCSHACSKARSPPKALWSSGPLQRIVASTAARVYEAPSNGVNLEVRPETILASQDGDKYTTPPLGRWSSVGSLTVARSAGAINLRCTLKKASSLDLPWVDQPQLSAPSPAAS